MRPIKSFDSIGRDDRGRDELASETIGRHSVSEIGCDGTARCAASLDAALDVRAQRPRGPLGPIDLGLLWIAELDAAGLGGGQPMACALADHVSLKLGSRGEHCVADDRENPRARR